MSAVLRRMVSIVLLVVAMLFCGSCSDGTGPESGATADIPGEEQQIQFTAADEGRLPSGWVAARTGDGEGSAWMIVADDSAPSGAGFVVAQSAKSPRSMFNLCVLENDSYGDVQLTVELKAVEGESDQGGGLVWRYLDENNYYVCRFNPLEDNLRIYKVIAGKRHQLASVDVKLAPAQWHRLSATMRGDRIVCSVAETQLSVSDNTLTQPGRIGFWTKADARTRFDRLKVVGQNVSDVPSEQLMSD